MSAYPLAALPTELLGSVLYRPSEAPLRIERARWECEGARAIDAAAPKDSRYIDRDP
jgi:hypothetical protein